MPGTRIFHGLPVALHPDEDLRPGWMVAGYDTISEAAWVGVRTDHLCGVAHPHTGGLQLVRCWRFAGHTGPHAMETTVWDNTMRWPTSEDMVSYQSCEEQVPRELDESGWSCTLPRGHGGGHVATFGDGATCCPGWINPRTIPCLGEEHLYSRTYADRTQLWQTPAPPPSPTDRVEFVPLDTTRLRGIDDRLRRRSFRSIVLDDEVLPEDRPMEYDPFDPPRSEINGELVQ